MLMLSITTPFCGNSCITPNFSKVRLLPHLQGKMEIELDFGKFDHSWPNILTLDMATHMAIWASNTISQWSARYHMY